MVPVERIVFAIIIMAGVTFFTRLVPFLFFSKRKPPPLLRFIETYIPPMVMVILVVYCFSDVGWIDAPHGVPELTAGAAAALLHLWKKNAFLSILGSTGLYMFFVQSGVITTFFF
jgi:branched-subunit amino acid transport protein AzlD